MQSDGRRRRAAARLTPAGMQARIHVTITDDDPYAQAFVVIEAVPPGTPHPDAASQN